MEAEFSTPGENRRQAFERLAEKRTNAVLAKIRILANCSNPYVYQYTKDDVRLIFGAIEDELRIARARFSGNKRREFKLEGRAAEDRRA